jgi:MoxR-vWA-beta-propeller ternary system protein
MKSPDNTCFFDTIYHLRSHEEVLFYNRFTNIPPEEEFLVKDLLKIEYMNECPDYPFAGPAYDEQAACWAAKTVYFALQLMLNREKKGPELKDILPAYAGEITPGAVLSADLCLRFLPEILHKTRAIDGEDALIPVLEAHLQVWHYSGIDYPLNQEALDFDVIFSNPCTKQLYIDRMMERKALLLAEIPLLKQEVKICLGDYGKILWKEFK